MSTYPRLTKDYIYIYNPDHTVLIDIKEFILKQNKTLSPIITNNSVNSVLYIDDGSQDDT